MKRENVGIQTKKDACVAVYLRVSTAAQRDDSQALDVEKYCNAHGIGNTRNYHDKEGGGTLDRPAFKQLQDDIFAGLVHTVIVWKLDRLSRSLKDGINTLTAWCESGIRIISVTQQLDFNGPAGKLIAAVLLAVAEMEKAAICERTRAGLAAAKAKGTKLGRPKGNHSRWAITKRRVDPEKARSLHKQGATVAQLAERFGCSRPTIYVALREDKVG